MSFTKKKSLQFVNAHQKKKMYRGKDLLVQNSDAGSVQLKSSVIKKAHCFMLKKGFIVGKIGYINQHCNS